MSLDETYTLASLEVGTPLQGPVVGHHRNKLWLKVPVVRTGAGGAEVPVDAMLKLPSKHRLLKNPEASLGQQLKVYVQAARTADATLVVSSKPPPSEELRGRSRRERFAALASCTPLEELQTGDALKGRVISAHRHGVYLDVGVSRTGKGDKRRPVDGLLPNDQRASAEKLLPGDSMEVRVLQNVQRSGRLLLTQVHCVPRHRTGAAPSARRR